MNEGARLQELKEYHILDTLPEEELNELTEIASAICDTPISIVSFIDKERQWIKAEKGLGGVKEISRNDSFCKYILDHPKDLLIVDDPLNDDRFRESPLVLGTPKVRFYAGAPLRTQNGNVLGTLCIVDNKPRNISEGQKKALKLLAKKAMDYLETRKLVIEQQDKIEISITRLKKLTDQAPGAIYQLEMKPDGTMTFPFISEGISSLHPRLNPEELRKNPEVGYSIFHPDDVELFKKKLQESYENISRLNVEYRVIAEDGSIHWHWSNAKPERRGDGTVVWYGTFQDITEKKEYMNSLEQILFDLSHVMRRPVANMLGLTRMIDNYPNDEIDRKTFRDYIEHMKFTAEEIDCYLKKLTDAYFERRARIYHQNKE